MLKKLSIALMTSALALPALAEYPDQPVQFVVPFPPGDLEDILTRMIADNFQQTYDVAAAVVNKPGGGGGPFPGAVEVANAPADGSTIGSFVIGVPVVGPTLGIPELQEDTFEPLGIFLTYPFVIATSKDSPYQTWDDLAAYAKDNKVALGHFGAGLPPTKATMALAQSSDFNFGSEAAFDALDCNTIASGDVDVMNTTIQQVMPCLDQVTVLAVVTPERMDEVPDAPTVSEINTELTLSLWNGLFVVKDTPQDVRDKIIAVAKETVLGDDAQALAAETGAQVYWMDAAESQARIDQDRATYQAIEQMLGE